MPSSSPVSPGHGISAAAAAAALSRPTAVEGFVSSLRTQAEVHALCDKYGVPKDRYTARPAGDLRANSTPPPGAICVYARALEAGLRFPLHGFFREALAHFGVAPAQLTPNGWRVMEGFLVLCHSAGVPPSLAVFLRFFYLSAIDRKRKKGWYCLGPVRDSSSSSFSLRFTGMPNRASKSIMGWKYDFFFLSSPEPWHCAVEWGAPSKGSFRNPALTVEENESVVKLLSAHGGAAVDLRNLLPATCPRRRRRSRLCNSNPAVSAAVITTGSPRTPPLPPPSSTRTTSCSKGMDPSVYDMMKVLLAEKAAAQASASVKKRTWEEANGGENDGHSPPLSVLSSVHSPPPQHFPSRHDGHTELLQGAVAQQLELEEKLVAREREAAALREQLEEQLEEAKNELAAAKRAADAEREKAKSELAAAGAEVENTKAELAAVEGEVVKTKAELAAARAEAVNTKAELAAARDEVVKTKAELAAAKRSAETELVQASAVLTAAKRAAETELVKVKAKLVAVEAELESAKAAAVQQLLASEENEQRTVKAKK